MLAFILNLKLSEFCANLGIISTAFYPNATKIFKFDDIAVFKC